MLFSDLQQALLVQLKGRVRNGELTERRLARLVGISQPHIHNVLKGRRFLSPQLADQILTHLRLSVVDLVPGEKLKAGTSTAEAMGSTYVPILKGRLGPGFPWPEGVDGYERFLLPSSALAGLVSPVVVRLADDVRMLPVFTSSDFALLDQSKHSRTVIDNSALYVVRRGRGGAIRRLRTLGRGICLATEDALAHPAAWERISLEEQQLTSIVRARAVLVARNVEWLT